MGQSKGATQQCNTTMQHNNVKNKTRNKEINETITLYKIGKFYNTYNDSAIILNYLFGYKILIDNKVGFPESALNKVINTLEDKKINYQIIDKDNNNDHKKYGNFNNYNKVLKQALKYKDIKQRVDRIEDLINQIEDISILEKLIEVIEDELQ